MIGGDSGFAGGGNAIGRTSSATIAAIGSSFASILSRDCAWRALVALARKRSTKACRCLRCASCFLASLSVERLALAALALERRIAAAIERELAGLEMQDPIDRVVEQVAVVADHDHGVRIAREVILQPERAFEIEIVGRLVEQQQIGLGEQHGRERDPHAPAAGEFRAGPLLRRRAEKPSPARIAAARAGAECAPISASRVWISAMRCGSCRGLGLGQQARALAVGARARPRSGFRGRPALPAPGGRCARAAAA